MDATKLINLLISGLNGVTSALNLAIGTINKGITALFAFNDKAIETARNIGMPFEQSIAYTRVLATDTQKLAMAYGVTGQKIAELQQSYAQATGKAIYLNTVQKEHLLQQQKLLGEQTVNTLTEAYAKMGGTTPGQEENLKMITEMSKRGLNLQTSSSAFAKNLDMANKYTFANGISGIEKMTALSQKLRFNLESFGAVADKMSSFEGAIEASARLQSLGGLGAAYGANPLTMMYEGLNDMEGLVERFTTAFKSMAVFDTKTGVSKISGQNLQIIKEQAKAIGLDPNEAVQMAKNGATADAIQGQMGLKYDLLNSDQQDFLTNKATWNEKTQKFEINVLDNKTGENVTYDIDKLSPEQIAQFQKDAAMTTTDAVKEASRMLTTTSDRQAAYFEMVKAMMADILFPSLGDLFQIQVQTFKLFGDIAQLVMHTITNRDWWKVLTADAIGAGVKALIVGIGWTLLKNPWLKLLELIWETVAHIAKWVFHIQVADYALSPMGLIDALGDLAANGVKKAMGVDEATERAVQQDYNVIKQDVKGFAEIGGRIINNVGSSLKTKLPEILQTYTNSTQNYTQKGGDISTSNATSNYANSSASMSTATYNANTSVMNYGGTPARSYNNTVANSNMISNAAPISTYYANTTSDGSVYYTNTSSNSSFASNTSNVREITLTDVVTAIDKQTDIISTIGSDLTVGDEVYNFASSKKRSIDSHNVTSADYSSEGIYSDIIYMNGTDNNSVSVSKIENGGTIQRSSSIIKGGEVTNGVVPVRPSMQQSGGQNSGNVTFDSPLSMNINGTINLVGQNGGRASIDTNQLLNNPIFTNALAQIIKERLNYLSISNNTPMYGIHTNKANNSSIGFYGQN